MNLGCSRLGAAIHVIALFCPGSQNISTEYHVIFEASASFSSLVCKVRPVTIANTSRLGGSRKIDNLAARGCHSCQFETGAKPCVTMYIC